jgi:cytochrome c5
MKSVDKLSKLIIPLILSALGLLLVFVFSCNRNTVSDRSLTPQSKQDNGEIDKELAIKGQYIYEKKCTECHSEDINLKGPSLQDVTKRRKADWLLKMIINFYKV